MADSYTAEVVERLSRLGLVLPENPPAPSGRYEPYRLHNGIGSLAGQVPGYGGYSKGRFGAELTTEQGVQAAELAGLNALARIRQALNGFDRLIGLLHVAGHVVSAEGFMDQPQILDGASALFLDVLGERGRHSRTAYCPEYLPWGIELEITFAYRVK
jgi:enamine deaminase RidA (YjgF/YER057c/UK114 family)